MYKSKQKPKDLGKPIFMGAISLFLMGVLLWYFLLPPKSILCDKDNLSFDCGCPSDEGYIKHKNVILIDKTDEIPKGKLPDIENIIKSYAIKSESFIDWIVGLKKTELTSVYILTEQNPSNMVPVARFCKPPPTHALELSTSKSKIRNNDNIINQKINKTLSIFESGGKASVSPIIEAVSTITSNANSWSPGSDLIIISDMLQNSSQCGWFESKDQVPSFSAKPSTCNIYFERLVKYLNPTAVYKEKSTIAICLIPSIEGKRPKEGVIGFWKTLFQTAVGYDLIESCDPAVIKNRKIDLRKS